MDLKSFEDEYKALEPIFQKCRGELEELIETQIRRMQHPELVRIRLSESRVKFLTSLLKKAYKAGWKFQDILKEAKDIIGLRIVCANIDDIKRVKELLLCDARLREIPELEEDRTITPATSGYRDYKCYISYDTGDSRYPSIICEIQIRTILQDSWAILAHKDIYKEGDDLPELLKKLSRRLSDLLYTADGIAQDIRNEITRKREPLDSGEKIITIDTLASVYKKAFDKLPGDYETRIVKNRCDDLGILNIESIEKIVLSPETIESLYETIHKKVTDMLEIEADFGSMKHVYYDELIFQISPLIAMYGIEIAADVIDKLLREPCPEEFTYGQKLAWNIWRIGMFFKNGVPTFKLIVPPK